MPTDLRKSWMDLLEGKYYLNRGRALDPFWRKLEEMEIEPVG